MNQATNPIYRIFLSSTAIDMEAHRQKVSDAIMRMGDLPVAMETFGARPNEPVEVCQNKVRECDALIVMVAHRYGWVPGADEGGDGHGNVLPDRHAALFGDNGALGEAGERAVVKDGLAVPREPGRAVLRCYRDLS